MKNSQNAPIWSAMQKSMRRGLARMMQTSEEQHDRQVATSARVSGCGRLIDHRHGDVVSLRGTVASVTLRPVTSESPSRRFALSMHEATGNFDVVFIGRSTIAGVDPGREMTVRGRLVYVGGRPVMYNPKYELHPIPE